MERPQRIIEIPLPRTGTLLTYRARGCRGNASPLRFSARTYRTIRTIRTIRTTRTTHDRVRVRENCVFQAVREVFHRFVGAVTRTHTTVPPVLRQFHPATIPPFCPNRPNRPKCPNRPHGHCTVPPVRWCRHPSSPPPFHRFVGAVTRPALHRSAGSLVPSPALSPSHRSFSLAFFLK